MTDSSVCIILVSIQLKLANESGDPLLVGKRDAILVAKLRNIRKVCAF